MLTLLSKRLVASFSPQRLGFHPRIFFVGFVENKEALEQNFRRVFRFSPAVGPHSR